jgi:hypothetical protein
MVFAAVACPVVAALLMGCQGKGSDPRRATLEKVTETSVRIRPTADQPPYCLAFTASEANVVRQLTMAETSIPCEADKPIGDVVYIIPPEEGAVVIYVLFSDQALESATMAQQIHDLSLRDKNFSGIDLRAPGRVFIQRLSFQPPDP